MNTDMKATLAKAMATMFAPVENVKYDLATGQTGIITDGGLVTLGADNTLDQNPMDFFSLALPAFAILTPASQVKRGDLLVSNGKAYSFILEGGLKSAEAPVVARKRRTKEEIAADEAAIAAGLPAPSEVAHQAALEELSNLTKGELSTLNVQGHLTRFRPRRVQMMGVSDGITVVKSFASLFGNTTDPTSAATNPMAAMLPLMLMSKSGTGKNDLSSMLPMMMMMGMGGGTGGMGSMLSNPLMLMALMGDGGIDGLFGK